MERTQYHDFNLFGIPITRLSETVLGNYEDKNKKRKQGTNVIVWFLHEYIASFVIVITSTPYD